MGCEGLKRFKKIQLTPVAILVFLSILYTTFSVCTIQEHLHPKFIKLIRQPVNKIDKSIKSVFIFPPPPHSWLLYLYKYIPPIKLEPIALCVQVNCQVHWHMRGRSFMFARQRDRPFVNIKTLFLQNFYILTYLAERIRWAYQNSKLGPRWRFLDEDRSVKKKKTRRLL